MILVALGANIDGPWGNPRATIRRALKKLNGDGLQLVGASRLMVTKAFGVTDQPDFVNAVARIKTRLQPEELLRHLNAIEAAAGRRRGKRWGPRTLDLDLLDYNGITANYSSGLILPHPGIAERLFVLRPLQEVAPGWLHPVLCHKPVTLIRSLTARESGAAA